MYTLVYTKTGKGMGKGAKRPAPKLQLTETPCAETNQTELRSIDKSRILVTPSALVFLYSVEVSQNYLCSYSDTGDRSLHNPNAGNACRSTFTAN